MNDQSHNADATTQLAAITANLHDQLQAQRATTPGDELAIAFDNGNPVYMLIPAGTCPVLHQQAAQQLQDSGQMLRHRYIGGSTPLILAVAA